MSSQSSIITVQQHIMREQKRFPGASGEFSFLLSGITLATKMIQAQVRRAGLTDVLGEHGDINVQGEVQQKLDILSNEALVHCLSARESIGVLASEENENPMIVHEGSEEAKICAAVHDELILLVKKEHVEKWRGLLKNAMESAEAKWLGDVPAIADVNVGETWNETH